VWHALITLEGDRHCECCATHSFVCIYNGLIMPCWVLLSQRLNPLDSIESGYFVAAVQQLACM
jgi:hypothetical protein